MTIGERIAALRKQAGLSQENLGEKMGVSRQSISKWEADASLPEIDKLIALSRLFGVSVGYLLGVEEEAAAAADTTAEAPPAPPAEELNEKQLHMVEEIVRRYANAQPKPKKRPRWHYALAGVAIGLALLWLKTTGDNIAQMQNNYNSLSANLNSMQNSVYHEINNITNRVEQILTEQNDLLAAKTMLPASYDLPNNTITFSFTATPRRFEEGTVAYIAVNNSGETETHGPYSAEGQTFAGEFTTELSDDIDVSVVLEKGDVRETQALSHQYYLYSDTLPVPLEISSNLWGEDAEFGVPFDLTKTYAWVQPFGSSAGAPAQPVYIVGEDREFTVDIVSMRLGLFIDKKLVMWAEPCDTPENYHGYDDAQFYCFPVDSSFTLKDGESFRLAAVAVDNFGREFVQMSYTPMTVHQDGLFGPVETTALEIKWDDPENWEY